LAPCGFFLDDIALDDIALDDIALDDIFLDDITNTAERLSTRHCGETSTCGDMRL
jgi:hypothetical protein